MTAEPLRPTHSGPYVAEDLDRIPDLPPHTELIDGNLIFVSPQALFHALAKQAIWNALDRTVPSQLFVTAEMTVKLTKNTRPEPDVLVVDIQAVRGIRQTGFEAADVLLVVEVVSPESKNRDRKKKPDLYAAAGIPHFWLVDDVDGKTVVEVRKLDKELGSYDLVGEFTDCLEVEEPFPVTLDLWEIDKRRS
ncbi:Uma2 family endonuclease [Catenulispora sp. GAS73]|uniref:Uma2 family endonuclease n=1 Tax=Catenulispora sp. GAS73 TaxID=3156269 RepID=UPI0035189535